MNQEPSEKQEATVSASVLFVLFEDDFVDKVVKRACGFRTKASPDTREAFKTTLRNGVKVKGFRDPSKAPTTKLAPEIAYEIGHNAKLASSVLQVWSEAQKPMRALVAEHLGADDIPIQNRVRRLREAWSMEEWRRRRDALCEPHSEFGKDDVGLMLCVASGIIPAPDEDEGEFQFESLRYQRWLDELYKLPIEAPEWFEAKKFSNAVSKLGDLKVDRHIHDGLTQLREEIDGLGAKYKEEMRYLGIDTSSWFEAASNRIPALRDAQLVVLGLRDQLKAYRPVHPLAPSRDEEQRRAVEREEYERLILKCAEEWKALMARHAESPVEEVAEERATYQADGADEESDDAKELAAVGEELAALKTRHETLEADYDALGKEHEQAKEAKAGMQLEKTQLNDQVAELKGLLMQSQQTEEHWRQAYVDAAGRAAVEEDAPVVFSNADEAIVHAERVFADELAFALNGKSAKTQPFQKPEELFKALAWLATEYHRLRPNPGPSPDFDRMIREACPGWTYKPNQTETTMGMYTEWYQTTWRGKRFELTHHVGKGNGRDPKNTIRIAFNWDDEHNRVVVGYIGLHQRNRQS